MKRIGMKSGERKPEGGESRMGRPEGLFISNSAERRQPISNLEFCRKASTHSPAKLNTPLSPVSAFRSPVSQRASSLITTLLVLVVLSTIVVAFMQSMSVERNVAKSVANRYRADLAVDAGVSAALRQLTAAITNQLAGGVAFTTWAYYPSTNSESYYSAITIGRPSLLNDTNFLAASNTFWLFSAPFSTSAGINVIADPDQITSLAQTNRVDLNTHGTIAPDRRKIEVPWFEVERSQSSGLIHIVRFAYWADDESSRWNVAVDRLNQTNDANQLRRDGASVDEISITNILSVSNALAISKSSPGKLTRESAVQLISTNTSSAFQTNKFLVTTRSIAENRIKFGPTNTGSFRRGMRKLNLNWSNLTNTSLAPESRVSIIADAIEQGASEFLSTNQVKYYPSTANTNPPSVPAPIWITREMRESIAASIIDYLDADSLPTQPATLLSATNTNSPAPPVRLMNDMPRPAFFGAEACPVINEVQVVWNATTGQTSAQSSVQRTTSTNGIHTYTIPVVWRFELWNMSDQPLTARNYKIRSFYLQQIRASAFGFGADAIPPDTEKIFDLGSLSFAPGEIKTVEVAESFTATGPNDRGTTWEAFRLGNTGTADDEPDGHNRCAYALFDSGSGSWFHFTPYLEGPEAPVDGNNTVGIGNKGPSKGNRINDPRVQPLRSYALNSGLTGDINPINHDGDRDWSSAGTGSIGRVNNGANGFNFQHFGFWFDKPRTAGNGSDLLNSAIISRIRNNAMASAGELGNIFDPSWYNPVNRGSDSDAANALPYRRTVLPPFKGGASLRIGQPSGNTNYAENSWILTDVFSAHATNYNYASDVYSMDTSQYAPSRISGQVNVNFPKAVVSGGLTNMNLAEVFRLPSLSVTNGTGTSFDPVAIHNDIKGRLTKSPTLAGWSNARPFFLPGEVSELSVWTNTTLYEPVETLQTFPTNSVSALSRLNRGDFAREEILQRTLGLLTTSGSAFRVYVVGQYCTAPLGNPAKITVRSTRRVELTAIITSEFDSANGNRTNSTVQILDAIYE